MLLCCAQVKIADGADSSEACVTGLLATEAAAAEREVTNAILSGNAPPAPVKPTDAVKHALRDRPPESRCSTLGCNALASVSPVSVGTVAIEMGVAGYVTERAWVYSHCEPFSGGLSRDGTSMSGNKAAAARASVDLSKLAWAARQ
eukprot:12239-Heterococcus_DN1.PRE.1